MKATEFAAAFREAAGFAEQKINLPQIDELLQESLISRAPQPLAQAVANFKSARNAHQARDRMVEIFRVAVRYVGLPTMSCCAQVGSMANSMLAQIDLRNLCRHSLGEEDWIELIRELCRPFARRRDAFPVPELVSLFYEQGSDRPGPQIKRFESLLKMDEEATQGMGGTEEQVRELLAHYLPDLAALLQALLFLSDYRLIVPRADYAECWMGLNRIETTICTRTGLQDIRPVLTDAD